MNLAMSWHLIREGSKENGKMELELVGITCFAEEENREMEW